MSAFFSFFEGVALAILGICWYHAVTHIKKIPNKIPIHFDSNGIADGYGNKYLLFILPVLGTFLYYFFFSPDGFSYYPVKITPENQEIQLNIGKLAAKTSIIYILYILFYIQKNITNYNPKKRLILLPWLGGLFGILIFFIILTQVYR